MEQIISNMVEDIKNGCSISEILKNNNLTINKYILIKAIFIDNIEQEKLKK